MEKLEMEHTHLLINFELYRWSLVDPMVVVEHKDGTHFKCTSCKKRIKISKKKEFKHDDYCEWVFANRRLLGPSYCIPPKKSQPLFILDKRVDLFTSWIADCKPTELKSKTTFGLNDFLDDNFKSQKIYVLFSKGLLVYIGITSRDLASRFNEHRWSGKKFDSYYLFHTLLNRKDSLYIEQEIIKKIKPPLNIVYNYLNSITCK